jgi:ATP-dependent DNA ligase
LKAGSSDAGSAQIRASPLSQELLQVARQLQLEGLIAKRPDSLYESGRRSGAWIKVKLTRAQDFVIGGYTMPEGARKYFGSLLVGYQSPEGLRFAGRVGTGFSEKLLALTRNCRNSGVRLALLSTCRRRPKGVGAEGLRRRS